MSDSTDLIRQFCYTRDKGDIDTIIDYLTDG
jgi:hypothetical protein